MKVGDLVQLEHNGSVGLVVTPPHVDPRISYDCHPGDQDQYYVVELSFWDGPYLACVDECEVISESG